MCMNPIQIYWHICNTLKLTVMPWLHVEGLTIWCWPEICLFITWCWTWGVSCYIVPCLTSDVMLSLNAVLVFGFALLLTDTMWIIQAWLHTELAADFSYIRRNLNFVLLMMMMVMNFHLVLPHYCWRSFGPCSKPLCTNVSANKFYHPCDLVWVVKTQWHNARKVSSKMHFFQTFS